MKRRVVISLCDLTGNFVKPWVEAGYDAILVDPQHGDYKDEGRVTSLPLTVEEFVEHGDLEGLDISFVAGFPPCTDLAVSGARWFKDKAAKDPYFQVQAVRVVEQCRMVGMMSGAPWFVENPVSVLSSILGKPDYSFHPWWFTGYGAPEDHYTKKTCPRAGGGPTMPEGEAEAGPGPDRANFRSATPMGFARAVFEANHA